MLDTCIRDSSNPNPTLWVAERLLHMIPNYALRSRSGAIYRYTEAWDTKFQSTVNLDGITLFWNLLLILKGTIILLGMLMKDRSLFFIIFSCFHGLSFINRNLIFYEFHFFPVMWVWRNLKKKYPKIIFPFL